MLPQRVQRRRDPEVRRREVVAGRLPAEERGPAVVLRVPLAHEGLVDGEVRPRIGRSGASDARTQPGAHLPANDAEREGRTGAMHRRARRTAR